MAGSFCLTILSVVPQGPHPDDPQAAIPAQLPRAIPAQLRQKPRRGRRGRAEKRAWGQLNGPRAETGATTGRESEEGGRDRQRRRTDEGVGAVEGTFEGDLFEREFLAGASVIQEEVGHPDEVLGIPSRGAEARRRMREKLPPPTEEESKERHMREYLACVWPPFCRDSAKGQEIQAILDDERYGP